MKGFASVSCHLARAGASEQAQQGVSSRTALELWSSELWILELVQALVLWYKSGISGRDESKKPLQYSSLLYRMILIPSIYSFSFSYQSVVFVVSRRRLSSSSLLVVSRRRRLSSSLLVSPRLSASVLSARTADIPADIPTDIPTDTPTL